MKLEKMKTRFVCPKEKDPMMIINEIMLTSTFHRKYFYRTTVVPIPNASLKI